jgi:hypothetical protein
MRTHERTHQTIAWAIKFIAAFLAGMLLASVWSCEKPTAASPFIHTENEQKISDYSHCFYEHFNLTKKLGGPLTVVFHDKIRYTPCPESCDHCTEDQKCPIAGWAWPGTRTVNYSRPWVNGPRHDWDLEGTAAHEVCHLTGIWIHTPIPEQPEYLTAGTCAALATSVAGCR